MKTTLAAESISSNLLNPIKILKKIIYSLLVLVGVYNALLISLLGNVNSDHTDTLMLWYGFKEHGWAFLKTWLYTQDNWLLSLFPFHALLFSIFPFTPRIILFTGLVIFLLNVLLSSLIAKLLGAKNAKCLVAIFILCSCDFFYFMAGPVEPITHNITNLFGLLSLFFSIHWVQKRNKISLGLISVCMLVGGLSDPWFMPTYALPLLFTSLILKKKEFFLFITVVISIALVFTRVLGLFYFLPGMAFSPANGSQIRENFFKWFNNLGLFINFFPTHAHWAAVASLIILLLLTGLIILKIRQSPSQETGPRVFFLTISFSVLIITCSFIFYANPSLYYLFNLFILGILGIVGGVEFFWRCFSQWTQKILFVLGLLFVISGLATTIPLWKKSPNLQPNPFEPLITLLTKQGWTYGYADYWTANAVTGFSKNTIRVRPMAFSTQNGYMYRDKRKQTSPFWYLPSDIPDHQKTFFIYLSKDHHREDIEFYKKGLTEQFGQPAISQVYQDGVIMVWRHPLKIIRKEDINSLQKKVSAFFLLMLI